MCDLDGNDTLSREEFSWFNLRTSGEPVAEAEWDVVEGREGSIDKHHGGTSS